MKNKFKNIDNFWPISVFFISCFIFNFIHFQFSFSFAILFKKFHHKILNFYFWPLKMTIEIGRRFKCYIKNSEKILSLNNFLEPPHFFEIKIFLN
jgi:hypothetical protein